MKAPEQATTTAYDRIRYPSMVQEGLHPASLSVFACLHDRPFAPASHCRILEIGCGEGINLMGIAATAPRSQCVGFDLAESAIATGRATAEAAGLTNVELSVMDILDTPDSLGEFDYIIAHGVYAWVPVVVRDAMMRLIGRTLAPHGLALISYNAMPGCRIRQIVRDILQDCLAGITDSTARLAAAKEWLEFFASKWSDADPLQEAMRHRAQELLRFPLEVIFHDEMGEIYEPQFVADVAAHARKHGLQYLCDAQPARGCEALIPSEEKKVLDERVGDGDFVQFEQQYDYASLLPYRESLLCRDGAAIDRSAAWTRVQKLHARGQFVPLSEGESTPGKFEFRTRNDGRAATSERAIADLLGRVGAAEPQAIPLADQITDPKIAETVLRLFRMGALSLQTEPFPFTLTPGERPVAGALARLQAARGESNLASLRHTSVEINDAITRHFISLLDGTRTRRDLISELISFAGAPEGAIAARLDENLNRLAYMALLAG
jgi:SAM-dependent methyltransferase